MDLFKPASNVTLGERIQADLLDAAQLLRKLTPPVVNEHFKAFREAFRNRYEYRWVPLTSVLDPELGLGFQGPGRGALQAGPLVKGLFREQAQETEPSGEVRFSAREFHLLKRVLDLKHRGGTVLELGQDDLALMGAGQELVPLPHSFILMLELAASSAEALDHGSYQALLHGIVGPSAARLLGRFCHGDQGLLAALKEHLRREEALRPEAVFAEIAHLPSGRMGNVLARPLLRTHELPFLGRSGADPERWIAVQDLLVGVVGERVVLWSSVLDREVVPRLSSAANFSRRPTDLYYFLAALQNQDVQSWFGFKWGRLDAESFLPRVVRGKFVLARAQWRIGWDGMHRLATAPDRDRRFTVFQQLRREQGWPRQVLLADGDHELPTDLDNVLSLEGLWGVIKRWKDAVLLEDFPGEASRAIRGPEGCFTGEFAIPYLARIEPEPAQASPIQEAPIHHGPGSEWLYAKLYTGPATADHLLAGTLGNLAREALASGEADGWFFVRYADPEAHVRLRFHGESSRLCAGLLPRLHAAVAPLLQDGWLWKVQLDTYEPEMARYGGLVNGAGAERLFQADSEAVLEILSAIPGDEGPGSTRWPLAVVSANEWLEAAGLSLEARLAFMQTLNAQSMGSTGLAEGSIKPWLAKRFREERAGLEALLDSAAEVPEGLALGRRALRERTRLTMPLFEEIRSLLGAGRLKIPLEDLLASLIHMGLNRLLRSTGHYEEFVIHHFLCRLYESRLARRLAAPQQ